MTLTEKKLQAEEKKEGKNLLKIENAKQSHREKEELLVREPVNFFSITNGLSKYLCTFSSVFYIF